MDSFARFAESRLPSQDALFSKYSGSTYSDAEYVRLKLGSLLFWVNGRLLEVGCVPLRRLFEKFRMQVFILSPQANVELLHMHKN